MLLDPKVEIECDACEIFATYDMAALSGGCFDQRTVKSQSVADGWIWADDKTHYCSQDCAIDAGYST